MSWIKLDDKWMRHPKIIAAGRDARDIWLASITWCSEYLTDGYLPANLVPSLAMTADVDVANCQNFAKTLVEVGLWDATENGYQVHDYLDYNPSKNQALATREARKEAGRAGGVAKASKAHSKKIAKDKQNSAPYPYPINLKKGAEAPSFEEPATPEEMTVPADSAENNEEDGLERLEESVPLSKNPERPSREIKFNDPAWDILHGKSPAGPQRVQPDTEWIPPDLKDLAEAFLEASNLPVPKDKSTRGYWVAALRTMRLDDKLTQDDVRRAVKKMRSTGGIIKSPESVRSVAVDIRAAVGPVFYAEEY